jgi:hypothetical protein
VSCSSSSYFKHLLGVLNKLSTFFHDMLRNPSVGNPPGDTNSTTANIIPIDATASDLGILLDFMTKRARDVKIPSDTAVYRRILKLCDLYGCDLIVEKVFISIRSLLSIAPWDVFVIASHSGDVDLAKDAIQKLGGTVEAEKLTLKSMDLKMAGQATLSFTMGLLRAVDANLEVGFEKDAAQKIHRLLRKYDSDAVPQNTATAPMRSRAGVRGRRGVRGRGQPFGSLADINGSSDEEQDGSDVPLRPLGAVGSNWEAIAQSFKPMI